MHTIAHMMEVRGYLCAAGSLLFFLMTFNPVFDSGHDSASVGCADSPILAPPLPYVSIYVHLYITGTVL